MKTFFLMFLLLWPPCGIWFPSQRSDQSHSCDIRHSCGNIRSLTHCSGLGVKTASLGSRGTNSPFAPLQELQKRKS